MARFDDVIVIELDGGRLSAIEASASADRVNVRRWLTANRPDDIAPDDASAIGRWIGDELKRAAIPRQHAVLAISRGDVVLKRLPFPRSAASNPAALVGMVRLAMSRLLTLSPDSAEIDFAPYAETIGPGGEGEVEVFAGAMPSERVRWWRAVAAGAGTRVRRIGLRCFGLAAMAGPASARRVGPVLGVSIGRGSSEVVVLHEGRLAFARAIDIVCPEPENAATPTSDLDEFVQRLGVETRRTWMGFRVAHATPEVEAVLVFGAGELARRVAERCGADLGVPGQLFPLGSSVTFPAEVSERHRTALAPLIGLAQAESAGTPALDFAAPREAPDLHARKRQLALAGVLALILAGGSAFLLGQQRLAGLRKDLDTARARETELRGQRERLLLTLARAKHLASWTEARVDWVAHLDQLALALPDPREGVLDEVRGSMAAEARFVPTQRQSVFPDGRWTSDQRAVFALEGHVGKRQTAQALRAGLLATGLYSVESRGPELPDRFSLELITAHRQPPKPESADGKGAP